jgi:hypothetical protein
MYLICRMARSANLVRHQRGSRESGLTLTQIGVPARVGGSAGLAPGPGGLLYTLAVGGDLDTINPATGVTRDIGPTGSLIVRRRLHRAALNPPMRWLR